MPLLLLRAFLPRFAGIFGQGFAQRVQARIGAAGQLIQPGVGTRRYRLQLTAKAVDTLALLQGKTIQLPAQFIAPGALFIAQHTADALLRAAQQQQGDDRERRDQ